jgi:hypothetical protein
VTRKELEVALASTVGVQYLQFRLNVRRAADVGRQYNGEELHE